MVCCRKETRRDYTWRTVCSKCPYASYLSPSANLYFQHIEICFQNRIRGQSQKISSVIVSNDLLSVRKSPVVDGIRVTRRRVIRPSSEASILFVFAVAGSQIMDSKPLMP